MELLLISFFAGVLTILAPCVLPMLPVIIGGSLSKPNVWRPIRITISLAASIVIFSLLLKASTIFIAIPQSMWTNISGGIILFFGIITLFPNLWENIAFRLKFGSKSQTALHSASQKKGAFGEILLGASLGPVFSSCSPTYFLIIATILPVSFSKGLLYLTSYAAGLSVIMFAIAFLGQKFISKLKWIANPSGWFKKLLGVLFILVSLMILTGFDKQVEKFLLDQGYGVTVLENTLLKSLNNQ